jgi:hypothetical protein
MIVTKLHLEDVHTPPPQAHQPPLPLFPAWQVWWRSDKAFHAGTVQAYVADEGVHLIHYDGDQSAEPQRVNLTQQHYQLTGAYRSADAEVADAG